MTRKWRALVVAAVVFMAFEATPFSQSFNQQIQAALTAMGWVSGTSQFSVWSKSFGWPAGSYLNFGSTLGSGGYGLRDNPGSPGTMQFRNSAGTWTAIPATGGAGGNVKFIVQQPDGTVPNAQALSALATGVVLNTTTTGVLSTSLLLPATNFPALTGAVTSPGGSLATTLTNAIVTLAKIQNATANSRILCSGSAGSGASYSECTLGSGLSLSGTVLSSTAASVSTTGGTGAIQYNTAGAFDSSTGLIWTQGSTLLTVTGTTKTSTFLVGNNSPSLTSPVNSAFALNHLWTGTLGSNQDTGAQLNVTWTPTGSGFTGVSYVLGAIGSITGSQAVTEVYGLEGSMSSSSSATIGKIEGVRAIAQHVTTTGTINSSFGVGSVVHVDHGTIVDGDNFHAYSPSVGTSGTLTRGVEFFGEDPLAQSCTACASQWLDFGSRGSLVVAPSPLAGFNATGSYYGVSAQYTITANADLGSGNPGFVEFNSDVTPSADWGTGTITQQQSYIVIHGTHQVTTGVIGALDGVGSAGSTSFTDTATGLVGLQVGFDYGSSGAAAQVGALQLYAGDSGAGVIANASELWLQSPYATTGVATNYAAIQIDDQSWPGSTTNYAIKYNAAAGKTFGVLANGNLQLGGATMTFPAANAAGVLTNDGSGGLSWGLTGLFPLFASAGTSSAPSYSWSTAHGVGLYQPSTNQTGIAGGVILGNTASAARGSILYVSGSGIAPSASSLIQLDLEPGLDTLRTAVVGQNAYGLYLNPVFSTSASGTNALVVNAYFDSGAWVNGGATITEASTVYIAGAPSIGASKYALHINGGYARFDGGSGEKVLTVATLPVSPQVGQRAVVNDATSPTLGSAVSGGGSAFAGVIWTGAAWDVYAK